MVYYHEAFSWKFILAELIIVVIGRFAAVYISYYLFACCPGKKFNKLNFRQLSFLAYAALIRGSIAFGLVLRVDKKELHFEGDEETKKRTLEVVTSTCSTLVVVTTCIFGGFTPMVQAFLLPKPKAAEVEEESQEKLLGEPKDDLKKQLSAIPENDGNLEVNNSTNVEDEDATVNAHHLFAHPNL